MPVEGGAAIALREEGDEERPFLFFTEASYVTAEPFNSYEKQQFGSALS